MSLCWLLVLTLEVSGSSSPDGKSARYDFRHTSQNWEDRGLTRILCFTKIRAHLGGGFRPGLPTSTLCTSPLSLSACVPRAIPAAFCLGLALRFPLRPPGLAPAEAQSSRRRSVVATLRSSRRCAWLCASWSVGTSRRRHACYD